MTSYATVIILELFTRLWKYYGKMETNDLSQNEERMKIQWNPPTPIENLFRQLREGNKFVSTESETVDKLQMIRYGYANIERIGVFTNAQNGGTKKLVRKHGRYSVNISHKQQQTSTNMQPQNQKKYTAAQVRVMVQE